MPKSRHVAATINSTITLDAAKIAALLKRARPNDLYTNTENRLRWYTVVSGFADALRDASPKFVPVQFFDDCGVPT